MAREDDFHLVLFDPGEDPEQPDTGTAGHRTAIWSQIFKAGILVVTAATIAFALVVGDPRVLLADATAFVTSLSTPEDSSRQEAPTVQSSVGTQDLAPTASVAPTNNDIAATSQSPDRRQTDIAPAPAQALLGQFQAWAAGQTEQAEVQVQPAQEARNDTPRTDPAQPDPAQPDPVQEANAEPVKSDPIQAQPVDEARAEVRPAQHNRLVRRVKLVRAENRAKPSHRARIQREQEARAQVQGPQDARAQVQRQQDTRVYYRPAQAREPELPLQNARPPSFLESIGLGSREQ